MKTNKFISWFAACVSFILIFHACGTPRPFIGSGSGSKPDSLKYDKVDFSVFLIGDTGAPFREGSEEVLQALKFQLKQAGDSSSVVFLGDNIYQEGMNPDTTYQARQVSESKISKTMGALDNYPGKSYFIPGNHDWRYGVGGVRAQERFVENYPGADIQFVPDNGCPGPSGFDLGENWFLITLDSEWWINQSFKANVDVEGCEIKTRAQVINKIAAFADEKSDKNIVLAFHHALYSSGNHAGYYPFRDHVFPLTNIVDNLYLPLPLIGSIYPLYRKVGQSGQDIGHDRYQEFKRVILEAVEDNENMFFASGHEHSLSFYQKEKQNENKEGVNHFIVSGSGSKTSYARTGYGAEFVYSHKGFAKLVSYENGKVDIEFWVADDENEMGKLVYVKELIEAEPLENAQEIIARKMKNATGPTDTVTTVAAGPGYKAGSTFRYVWGDHYRDAWTTEVEIPVFDFKKKNGGIKVLAQTGGEQTLTLIVQDSSEQQYVMRSVQKDPTGSLPEVLQPTFVSDIARDQTSASHPYSSTIVPSLATAAGIYHTTPELYFVSTESGLDFDLGNEEGTLMTFQDFVSKEWFSRTYGKNAVDVISSDELWEKMRVGYEGNIDQKQLVRSRIFDMFIGDWDRHEGQWFWAEVQTDSTTIFEPIPIDRDNAFFKSDGAIPWIGRRKWALRKFQLFDDDIRDIAGINFNAQFFDRWFINELSQKEWIAIAEDLQASLTDSVIAKAVAQWPPPIQQLNGETFTEKLKARRGKLTEFAERYYDVLSKNVNVFGSDNPELFEVERRPNSKTVVTMYGFDKDSTAKKLKYQRTFEPGETAEIRLYGFGGNDQFSLNGRTKDGQKIRVIGGEGKDIIDDQSSVKGIVEHTVVYDTRDGSKITSVGEVENRTSNDPMVNRYEKRSFEYDLLRPLVTAGYNRNDGIFLGGGALIIKEGFRKEPFASKHRISGKIATLTQAFSFQQNSIFTDAVGVFNVEVNTDVLAPNFSSNFFGLGNDTEKFRDSREFYGYRINNVDIDVGLSNEIAGLLTVYGGTGYEFFDPQSTNNRFVTSPQSVLDESDFAPTHYATLQAGFNINTVDDEILPRYGIEFDFLSELNVGATTRSSTYGRLSSSGRIFYTLEDLTTTIAARVGLATNIGGYNFYQANTLGGQTFTGGSGNLRGFLRNRFAGRTRFFHNTEIRTRLFDLETLLLPASVGVLGFFDEGRVWADGENSNTWHYGYGGGIWISPLDRVVLTTGLALSEEETLYTLTLGFAF